VIVHALRSLVSRVLRYVWIRVELLHNSLLRLKRRSVKIALNLSVLPHLLRDELTTPLLLWNGVSGLW